MNTTLQYLFSKFSAKFGVFFGFKHNFHQTLIYVAYAYHTWMESCACKLNFDTKMFGLPYVPKEQGILLTVRKNSCLQPDTAAPPPGASPTHVSAWTGRMEERGGRQCVSRPKARESARGETVT